MAVDVNEANSQSRNEKRLIFVNENNQNKVVGYLPDHDYANLSTEKVQKGLEEHKNIYKSVAQNQENIRNQQDLIGSIGTNSCIKGEEEDE
jgi:hypothetical protein